jgi:imidazolonepropionase
VTAAPHWDDLWLNVNLATMDASATQPYGIVEDGALATHKGRIAWLGPKKDLPAGARATRSHDAHGAWLTPGLIDCHTHLVYGGSRANEFEARLDGASYESIAQAGGGIRATVRATRLASDEALTFRATERLADLIAEGVTTIEIKSGYGLDLATELRMLEVARQLGLRYPVTVMTTLLAAHAVPEEFTNRADDYIDLVCNEIIPRADALKLADAVDAFCEHIAFTPTQVERVFRTARAHGLAVKLHADQLSDLGGAALAARFGALSADHLEYTSERGVAAMAASGTVAVLLPGAFYFLRESRLPPIDGFRARSVPMAIATDCNPGSSPCTSLLLILNMACTLFRLTPAEALAGVTRHAARALGLATRVGQLRVGLDADLALWDVEHPRELCYAIGANPLIASVHAGALRERDILRQASAKRVDSRELIGRLQL